MKQLNLIPAKTSQKEKKGLFDKTFLKTFPNLSAILLLKQLDRFNDVSSSRLRVVKHYNSKLIDSLNLPDMPLITYPLIIEHKDALIDKASLKGINFQTSNQYVINPQVDHSTFGYLNNSCPNAESISQKILDLPTSISKSNLKTLVSIINASKKTNN